MESAEDKATRKKRMEKIHQDIAHELVGISKKIERAFPDRKGEMMGFGADATGAALSSGMSFLETPSWEGAGKLAEAGAQAAEASNTSCKPDPVVTAMIGGALALLTGGIGGALATVLGAAGAMLPSIMGAAFGCPEGKRKMGEAIKKCLEAMDPKILWSPLNIYSEEDVTRLKDFSTRDPYNYGVPGLPLGDATTGGSGGQYREAASPDSDVGRARLSTFISNVVGYISGGLGPEDAVKNALLKSSDASSWRGTTRITDVTQTVDDAAAEAKRYGTDPAAVTKDLDIATRYGYTAEQFDTMYPGWRAVALVVKSCVENAVVKAAAEKAGTRVPAAAMGPVAQVQIYNPAPASGGGMNLLPLVIGGGLLAVALAAKNRGGGES